MAERLKTKILETDKMVDLVAGPGKMKREFTSQSSIVSLTSSQSMIHVLVYVQIHIAVYLKC